MTVAEVVISLLEKHGVKQLFGIPGDAINDLMEAVRKTDKMSFIQVKHEECGAFAASIQAKLTGQLTACVGTSGPGAVHLLNGLYDAKLDHAPVLAITGQVASRYIGTNYHQEVDTQRLFSDVAVYSQTITSVEQFPAVFMEACRAAITHRGVAHLSLPSDISSQSISYKPSEFVSEANVGKILPNHTDCSEAVKLLEESSKVAILAGVGAQCAREELLQVAQKLKAPIVRSLRAKTVIDDHHPLCAGGIGLLGGKPALQAFKDCDVLLMVGTDFPYQEFYPEHAKVIQIDLDPCQIGKRHPVDLGVVGHSQVVLQHFIDELSEKSDSQFLETTQAAMSKWRKEQEKQELSDEIPIKPQRLLAEIGKAAPNDTIFVCDTGTVNGWAARHLQVHPSQMFTQSSSLGSMGVGLPGAIGARFAFPERPVVAIVGDGGFTMTMMELITAVHYQLPITIVILNNSKLGFIAMEQEAKGLPAFGIELNNPDFVAIAKACGAEAQQVTDPKDLGNVLSGALASEKPFVIDVEVNPDELLMPPRIETKQAMNFARAKVKEFFA